MKRDELKEILLEEYDMQYSHIEETLTQIVEFDDDLKAAFETFLQTKVLPELSAEGYSLKMLTTNHRMTPIGAFLAIDWLKKEPEEAKRAFEFGI